MGGIYISKDWERSIKGGGLMTGISVNMIRLTMVQNT